MEIFYAYECDGRVCRMDGEESAHCVKVLRRRVGDEVHVIDGKGTMFRCRLTDASSKGAEAEVLEAFPDWGAHLYRLTIGCCPTKNNDRFETFVEKAVEIGVDCIVPLIGEHSERKVYKTERAERIALAATKQSLKAALPEIREAVGVRDFVRAPREGLKLIAYCFEGEQPRRSIKDALAEAFKREGSPAEVADGPAGAAESAGVAKSPAGAAKGLTGAAESAGVAEGPDEAAKSAEGAQSLAEADPEITVLIGPEGDFSAKEAAEAIKNGYIPVHLGPSRLRTETAAITAAEAVYFHFM